MRIPSLLALLALACARNPAPSEMLRSPAEMQETAFGSYIAVEIEAGDVEGELIAVEPEGLNVLSRGHLYWVAKGRIRSARLAAYHTGETTLGVWTGLGVVSTLSHGFILVISAPVWTLIGTPLSVHESYAGLIDYPDEPLDHFRPFARFPQGLPPGVDVNALLHGRPAPASAPASQPRR